ncbi:hypothetical protein ACFW2I_36080 [Streptomyces nigra]|uniref:hypothetical protein n=1 Tax=Streptomyces nigra TaxID=1827580 RepID=UPI003698B220
MVAGQERLRVLVDLEAWVGDQRAQFALAQVGPGVAIGELGGRAADFLAGGEAFAGLGEGLGQGQALLLVKDLEHVGLGAVGVGLRHDGGRVSVLHRERDPAAGCR